MLVVGGIEMEFILLSNQEYLKNAQEGGVEVSDADLLKHQYRSRQALRCEILRCLLGETCRELAMDLAHSPLYQWFCHLGEMDRAKIPGKSRLNEYSRWLNKDQMRQVIQRLILVSSDPDIAIEKFGLLNEMELQEVWMDSTCIKSNIHFPVDWVLLRDGVRTLMKATRLIREHGLRRRMESPETFISQMNKLCMAMTFERRKPESKKQRKKIFRQMKKLSRVVMGHARRHHELLDMEWEQTDWTRGQAEQVLERIDGVMKKLPAAIKQAHERVIGERLVKNEDKILSLYEEEVRVIVRGKAGAEVEFGNELLLAEQRNGMILDWELYLESVADPKMLKPSLQRMETAFGEKKIEFLGTDRGFSSRENSRLLAEKKIYDGTCPRNVLDLREKLKDSRFREGQKRRSQTEGRIGVFKNVFCGRPMRSKGFENRELSVAWNVLTHNLWVLARQPNKADKLTKKELKIAA